MISYKLSGLKSLTLLLFSLPFLSFAQEISPTLSNYPGGYNISCHGANNGFINIVVVGDAPPFLYNWSNGATTKNISQLIAGNYTLIVTDANSNTVSMDFDLSQPNLVGVILHPRVFEGGHNIPEPGGNDGLIETEISGGVSPYSYSWSNGSIEQNLEGVEAGTYTLTVTDMNGCSASASATLTEASVVHVTNISSPFQNGYNISCHGIKDGSIQLDVAGGTPPYDFTWMDGYKEKDRTELGPGNYTVIIKDLNDIAEAAQILLTGPTELQAQLTPTIYANTKNISCYGCANGHITTTVTGGVSPYTYLWNDGATSANRNGLVQGQYNVQITDANGCVIEAGLNIIGPEREDWTMMGNAGTDPVTNFFGTTDNKDMVFKTNNVERFRIRSNGKVEALGGLKLFANSADLYQSVYADETGLLRTGPSGSGQCDAPATAWFEDVCSNRTSIFNFPLSKLVGIGTKTPDAELDVFGQIRSSVLSGTAGFNVVHTGADGKLSALHPPSTNPNEYVLNGAGTWSQLSGALAWIYDGTYIHNQPLSANVGIGNNSPTTALDVTGQIRSTTLSGTSGFNVIHTGVDGKLVALSPPTNNANQYLLDGSGAWSQLPPGASVWSMIGNNIVTDPSTSRVGIKTQTPNDDLDIGGLFTFHGGNANKWIGFNNYYDYIIADPSQSKNRRIAPGSASRINFGEDGSIKFKTAGNDLFANSEIIFNDAFQIDNAGKIGINSNPNSQYALNVSGILNTDELRINGSPLSSLFTQWQQSGNNIYYTAGNVGIGTSTPYEALSVNGALSVTSSSAQWGYGIISRAGNDDTKAIIVERGSAVNFLVKGSGQAYARGLWITYDDFPDYVFEDNYNLMSIDSLKGFIRNNGHLPKMPSKKTVESQHYSVAELQQKTLEKVEELYLYVIQLKEENDKLRQQILAK